MESILSQIQTLPPLPPVVCQLTTLIDDPNSNARDMAEVISKDQSLTARVLRLVNSSYYAFRSKISKVSYAISLMGLNSIKNIVLSLSLIEAFRKKEVDDGLDHEKFWEHSIGTAAVARSIGQKSGYFSPEEAFIAGLLHDIGKVILDFTSPADYRATLKDAKERELSVRSVEMEYFGYDHTELGAELAKYWSLPDQLKVAIRDHHKEKPEDDLARIVFTANMLCKGSGVGFSGDDFVGHISDDIWGPFDISKQTISQIFSGLRSEVDGIRMSLGIDHPQDKTKDQPEQWSHIHTSAPSVLVASQNPNKLNIVQLVLEQHGFRVKTQGLPAKMTCAEKRETSLIIIDSEGPSGYPSEIKVSVGEAITRRIPVLKITTPFQPRKLVDKVCLLDEEGQLAK